MTTKQRKALQAVVLEAGELMLSDEANPEFTCVALRRAFRFRIERAHGFGRKSADEMIDRYRLGLHFADCYWEDLMQGTNDDAFEDRMHDALLAHVFEARLLALALLHTLIGSGDFEVITGYRPDNP